MWLIISILSILSIIFIIVGMIIGNQDMFKLGYIFLGLSGVSGIINTILIKIKRPTRKTEETD